MPNGLIYLAGGCDGAQNCNAGSCSCSSVTSNLATYDPVSDAYSTYASPLPPMPLPRYRHLACAVDDTIYYFGGRDLSTDAILTAVDAFNTTTRQWLPAGRLAAYPPGLGSDNSCTTANGLIYVFGGYTLYYDQSLNATYTFDPSGVAAGGAGVWTVKRGQLATGRGDFSSVLLSGLVHIYGGYTAADFCTPINTHEVYNPATDSFAASTSLPMHLAEKDDGVVLNGRVFSIGGEHKSVANPNCTDQDILPIDLIFAFNPALNNWTAEAAMPDYRMRFASAAVGESLYMFGGQGPVIDGMNIPILYAAYAFSLTGGAPAVACAAASPSFGAGSIVGAVLGTAAATLLVVFVAARARVGGPALPGKLQL